LVAGEPEELASVDTILNNSFGMVGINSVVIVKRFVAK
jgi:3-oxoacyl-[acyl-carrier-protein] synthase II